MPIAGCITAASFSFLSADEIRAISVKAISNPLLFDSTNLPTEGGLYDPVLGPLDRASMYAHTLHLSALLLTLPAQLQDMLPVFI